MFYTITHQHFDQPAQVVLDFMMTPANAPRWSPGTEKVEPASEEPLQSGESLREYLQALGRPVVIDWTIEFWGTRKVWWHARPVVNGVTQEDQTMIVTYTLFPAEDGGTDFVREVAIQLPEALAGMWDQQVFEAQGAEALSNVKRILDEST
jgi:hypothetical protein